jgi:protocatechuate 3,4-dioxygenase beta subunit
MDLPSSTELTRRGAVAATVAGLFLPALPSRGLAAVDVQPMARASHFPQMPTGFVGVTPCGSHAPPATIHSFGRIAPENEPGEALEISGIVYRHDRRTPAPGMVVFAYHTDARGRYNTPNSPFNPRLYGWVKSDGDGRYVFRTIRPAPYPDHSTPAHIHVSLFGAGVPEYWVDDYWFAGDPLITPAQRRLLTNRGGGGETMTLRRGADGVLRGKRDFVVEHVTVSGGCTILST